MNGSFRVGNLFGIPFYLNASWFLVLALVTFSYGSGLASQFPELGVVLPWTLGLVAALLLFSSVLAHELGHSFVAQSQGIEVKSITLFLFGGLASLGRESKTPGEAFWVAIAGPLVSLGLFGLFTAIVQTVPLSAPLAAILGLLATINLILALFNLIPGLPLDGGNILKSVVWKVTGNPYKGTVFASRVGQVIGWLAIASGVIPLFFNAGFNFWNVLIGWFLLQNAGTSAQSAQIQEKLDGLTAADAVTPDSPVVPANLSLREFANNYVIGRRNWRKYIVTDENQQLIGALSVDSMRQIPTSDWNDVQVSELMESVDVQTVESNQSLLEVVTLLESQKITELPVIGENGTVLGLLEKNSVIRLLQNKNDSQAKPA
ncbi:CBS domain-containing protein [Geitlerinema sp. P-1104]|uniref:site-2 protease family protein n=1 Tax=Geitlerinema sp. P-1104 TaxID=2546230 RepID=UPI0014777AC0|nr:site-2 protease family protein [Geitlerinema sp. P-1104]NMG58038.1 CBS domain-containing protein [Geitlerinema sp. P-1104]